MKKVGLLLGLALSFVSCSRDNLEIPIEIPTNPLEGTVWFYEQVDETTDYLEFEIGNTYQYTSEVNRDRTGTYIVKGDRLTLIEDGDEANNFLNGEGTFIIEGDLLKLFFDSGFAIRFQRALGK